MYGPELNQATSKEGRAKHHFPLSLVNKGKCGLDASPAQVKPVQGDSAHQLQSLSTGRMSQWELEGSASSGTMV